MVSSILAALTAHKVATAVCGGELCKGIVGGSAVAAVVLAHALDDWMDTNATSIPDESVDSDLTVLDRVWVCERCGHTHVENPEECDDCGFTIFAWYQLRDPTVFLPDESPDDGVDDRSDDSVSAAIIQAIAEIDGVQPVDLPPLCETIDLDVLDSFFDQRAESGEDEVVISFEYHGYVVTVAGDGSVEIEDDTS